EGSYSFPWENIKEESCGLPPRDVDLTALIEKEMDLHAVETYLNRFCFASLKVKVFEPNGNLVREVPKTTCWSPNLFLSDSIPLVESAIGGYSLALDVGSGTGRDMVFLASRGWNVIGIENRRRLIDQGVALSRKHGVSERVHYLHCDLKDLYPVKNESVDLLHVCRFLHRPSLQNLLKLPRKEGKGYLIYSHFLDGCQRTKVGHPSTVAGFFLRGELRQLLESTGYTILTERENALPDGRPMVNIFARRME
ncbi:uncharacterized protein TM35_000351060, partial [Trypanosoma theileri]